MSNTLTKTFAIGENISVQALLGANDCNLTEIKRHLEGVDIRANQTDIIVTGQKPYKENFELGTRITMQLLEFASTNHDAVKIAEYLASLIHSKAECAEPEVADAFNAAAFGTPKKLIQPRNGVQSDYAISLKTKDMIFGIGPAGTGKTFLPVAAAVEGLLKKDFERIIMTRPVVEAGEKLGFLPGDMKEKIDPYMQPLYDALNDMVPPKQVQKMIEDKVIEIAPLAYMRGRTLKNAFVILDEAQNTTTMQMKMFLTRMGEGTRMAITGDTQQVDLPKGVESGLQDAFSRLQDVPEIGVHQFDASHVVRHPLVAKIIRAYDV